MGRAATAWTRLDYVAAVVERLAVLLAAGVSPSAAWGYLAEAEAEGAPESDGTSHVVRAVALAGVGRPVGEVILEAVTPRKTLADSRHRRTKLAKATSDSEDSAWRGLAAAWIVASDAGAPLASGLLNFAGALRALAQARRDTSVALSGPVATAKLVLVLPIIGILFGMALGFDTLGTLVTTVPGMVCLVGGGLLLLAGRAWNRKLVVAATPTNLTPGLVLDLFAIAVSGGASLDRARNAVTSSVARCGIEGTVADADAVLSLASRAGVPAGVLLQSEADRVRRDATSDADRRAAKLAVTLMIPLGLCVLPAFMLVGVAPLMIAVLSSTVDVF